MSKPLRGRYFKTFVFTLIGFVRNPMYVGVASFVVGQALVFRSGAVLVLYRLCLGVV